jgi:PadR family transcriptional regulator AphA
MSITHALLGYLSWRPMTGYDLKKLVADTDFLPWSGNSNQIYTTLVQLARDGLVVAETEQQANLPPRKVYTLTPAGRETLRAWVASKPSLLEMRSTFLVQLAWADQLGDAELAALVTGYEQAVENELAMCRERLRRGPRAPARTTRERLLWKLVHEHQVRAWEAEFAWARLVCRELGAKEGRAASRPGGDAKARAHDGTRARTRKGGAL